MIKMCSLVSSHWANLCRPTLLERRLANIASLCILKSVRCMFEWKGSSSLYDLRDITTRRSFEISVYPTATSDPWLHHVALTMKALPIKTSTTLLKLDGLGSSPRWKQVDIPFCWNLPRTLSPIFFSIFTHIDIQNYEFSSLDRVIMLLTCFRKAQRYNLQSITWATEGDLAYIRNNGGMIRPGSSLRVVVASECSSNAQLCLRAGLLFPDFPLAGISVEELSAVRGLLESFHAHSSSHMVHMEWGEPWPSFIYYV
jgi:hypothetical protein